MLSNRFFPFRGAAMIPLDGAFAQNIVYPLAFGAYDAEEPPPGYTYNVTAFDILADLGKVQARLQQSDKADPKQRHRKPLDAMLKHSRKPRILSAREATSAAVGAMVPNPVSNNHCGWVCIDQTIARLIVRFRGTENFKDWLDDFDFAPAPYRAIPGRGTVHLGFQIVYETVRDNLRALVKDAARIARRFSSLATASAVRSPFWLRRIC